MSPMSAGHIPVRSAMRDPWRGACLCDVPLRVVGDCATVTNQPRGIKQDGLTDVVVIVEGDNALRDRLERALHGYTVDGVGRDRRVDTRGVRPGVVVTDERLLA